MDTQTANSTCPAAAASDNTYKVLVFHEMAASLYPLIAELNRQGFLTMAVSRREEILSAIGEFSPDVVLLNFGEEGAFDCEFIKGIKARDPHLPLVAMADRASWKYRAGMFRAGAEDYVAPSDVPGALGRELKLRVQSGRQRRQCAFEHEKAAVRRFAAAVCRRLEEPNAGLGFYCRLMQMKDDLPKDLRPCLEHMEREIGRLIQIAERLQRFGSDGGCSRKLGREPECNVPRRAG